MKCQDLLLMRICLVPQEQLLKSRDKMLRTLGTMDFEEQKMKRFMSSHKEKKQ